MCYIAFDTFLMEKPPMDYYEAPAEGVKAALCPACGQVKPLRFFEQRVPKAVSMEQGYAGNVRKVHMTTKCSACRPKPKPLAKRTAS